MKTIYLVRHAKAVKDADMPDFERPLEERGKEDARRAALKMKRFDAPDLLVSSPAARALETAGIFAEALGLPVDKIARRKALYDQTVNAYRTVLREMKDTRERIMLFGHNPSITEAAQAFAPEFHDDIPTAGVVIIVFDSASWKEIAEGGGKLAGVEYPKNEKKSEIFKRMKKDMTAQLTTGMNDILSKRDRDAAESLQETVGRAGEKIACAFVKRLKGKEKKSKGRNGKSPETGEV